MENKIRYKCNLVETLDGDDCILPEYCAFLKYEQSLCKNLRIKGNENGRKTI
jgi:hypothetical protein